MADTHSSTTPPTTPEPSRQGGDGKAPRGRTLSYGRRSPARINREQVVDVLKTLVWVIPLTILIWVYAEREQSVSFKSVTIPITLRINSSAKVIMQRDPAITATVTGPHTNVQDFLKRLERPDQPGLVHTIDPSTPAGDIQIPVTVLNDDPMLVRNGITLSDITPKSLQATVDDVVSQQLPVRTPVKIAGLEGEPRFTPETVKVTAPRSLFEEAKRLQKTDKPYLTVDLTKLEEIKSEGTKDVSVPVNAGIFSAPGVHLSDTSVSAHFTVRPNLATFPMKNITVWPAGPDQWLDTHHVEFVSSKTLDVVVIEGPPEKISSLAAAGDPQGDKLKAYVDLGELGDDGEITRPVTFHLPAGTHLQPGQRNFEVTLRVTPRAGP